MGNGVELHKSQTDIIHYSYSFRERESFVSIFRVEGQSHGTIIRALADFFNILVLMVILHAMI